MTPDMDTRLSKAEWEIQALKEAQGRHEARMTELSTRIDVHHKEVMTAIGSLRDDRSRAEGAAEERINAANRRKTIQGWVSLVLGIIGTLLALGWLNTASGM